PLLDEDQRWALVSFVRTLSLEGASGSSAGPMEADHVAQLGEVRHGVEAALAAHRRGDPEAMAFATHAYLRFEPLEKIIAESDASRIDPIEQAFVAFRTALASPAAGDPEVLGRKLQESLEGAVPFLGPASGQTAAGPGPRRPLVAAGIAALVLLAMAYAI